MSHTLNQKQINCYNLLFARVKRNELSPNQAYKVAINDPDPNVQFKGSFAEWLEVAKENGWLSDIQDIMADITPQEIDEDEKKKSPIIPILVGTGLLITAFVLYKKYKAKQA